MQIKLITTIDKKGYMTKGNALLTDLNDNFKHFKLATIAKPLIYGRKSAEELKEILPYRPYFVLSKSEIKLPLPGDNHQFDTIKGLINHLKSIEVKEAFVIGGPSIIHQFVKYNLFDELIITHVDADLKSDIRLNLEYLDLPSWNIYNRIEFKKSNTNAHDFTIINYIKPKKRFR